MATLAIEKLNRVRYVGNDFDTHFDDLRGRLQVQFAEDFNDFALSSLGIMLLDLVAYGLDSLSFYLDRRASDAYLDTARTRKAVARLSRQLGYKIGAAVASSVDVRVAIVTPVGFSVPVPKGYQLKGPNQLIFETAELVTFDPGSGPNEPKFIPCYEGETVVENFVSDGSPNQSFELSRVPDQKFIVQGTMKVAVNLAPWVESEFITFDKTDQFEVGYNDEPPTLRFGDGVAGNIPGVGASVTATYVASRGLAGQVIAGSIIEAVSPLIVSFQEITLSIENLESSIGGDDPEALEKVKVFAGKVFKSRQVAVTRPDYKALAGSFADPLYGRVAVAQAVSSRSASQDLALLNSLFAIRSLIDPVKDAINTLTATERTVFETMLGYLEDIRVIQEEVATNLDDANTVLDPALAGARTAKNTAVEMNNDAADIISETVTAGTEVEAIPVATPNLAVGSGPGRVLYIAMVAGQVGEAVRIAHVTPFPSVALSIGVAAQDITVTMNPASTAVQVATAIMANGAASALVSAYSLGAGNAHPPDIVLTPLGYTTPASLAVSGIVDTTKAAIQQRLDRCKTEATNIQAAAAGIQAVLDSNIAANILTAQEKLLASGFDITIPGSKLFDSEAIRQNVEAAIGEAEPIPLGLFATASAIDTAVVPLDTTGAVTVSVGNELDEIFDHVDKMLADDCKANLVTVPILTRNVAGFYSGPSLGLQQSLQAYLDVRKEVTQTVKVTSGANSLVNAILTVRISVLPGYAESVVKATVATVIDGVLKNRVFGASLYVSELVDAVLDAVEGVAFLNIEINGYRDPNGVFQTDKLDADGNLIIQNSEVVTKDLVVLALPALSGVSITTEIFSQGV